MLEDVNSLSRVGAQPPRTFQSPSSFSGTTTRTSHLDRLPLEIIQRILCYGSCKAILALRCVCRVLYHACSDLCIVNDILKRGSIQDSNSTTTSSLAWYDSVLSPTAPLSSWMRYALAHEDLDQFIQSLIEENHADADGLRRRRLLSYLPQLLALHCEHVSTEAE